MKQQRTIQAGRSHRFMPVFPLTFGLLQPSLIQTRSLLRNHKMELSNLQSINIQCRYQCGGVHYYVSHGNISQLLLIVSSTHFVNCLGLIAYRPTVLVTDVTVTVDNYKQRVARTKNQLSSTPSHIIIDIKIHV